MFPDRAARNASLRGLAVVLCVFTAGLPSRRAAAQPDPVAAQPDPVVAQPDPVAAPAALTGSRIEVRHRRPHTGLLTAGLVLFAAAYASDIGVTYGYDHQPASTSLIPLVGPFIQLTQPYGLDGPPVDSGSTDADARIRKNVDNFNSTIRGLAMAGAAIAGVAEITGLALTIAGAVLKKKHTRYALGAGPLAGRSGVNIRF